MNFLSTRFFRHYKNKPYRYLGIVKHSETLEDLVLYETLYANETAKLWVRPKEMFFEDIVIDGQKTPRFKPIEFIFKEFTSVAQLPVEIIADLYPHTLGSKFILEKFLLRVKDKSKIYCLVAYDGMDPIAFKLGYAESDELFYSWTGGTSKEFRGLGIATELMRRQHAWCKAQGFKTVKSHSQQPFRDMMRLNLAMGFDIVGTQVDGKKQLKVIFQKELS